MTASEARPKFKLFARLSQAHLAIGIKDTELNEIDVPAHNPEPSVSPTKTSRVTSSTPPPKPVRTKSFMAKNSLTCKKINVFDSNEACKENQSRSHSQRSYRRENAFVEDADEDICSIKEKDKLYKSAKQRFPFNRSETVPYEQIHLLPKNGLSVSPASGKRKRYSSADYPSKSHVTQVRSDRSESFGTSPEGSDKKDKKKQHFENTQPHGIKNRLSGLYASMRFSQRRKSSEYSEQSSNDTAEQVKNLRALEEVTCQDVPTLLKSRVAGLRKVADPDSPAVQEEEREEFPLFEYVCEVSVREKGGAYTPYISWGHPPTFVMSEERELAESINSLPMFCFPDMDLVGPVKKMKTETYCFVFTDLQAQNKFGFCRRCLPKGKDENHKRFPVVYCIVTKIRSFETFVKIFDQLDELRNMGNAGAYSFLKALIEQNAPRPGKSISVKFINTKLGDLDSVEVRRTTADQRLEHVDLAYVISKLGSKLLVDIFINLLIERKVLFVADSLGDLTSIIHSIMQLLHPLQWQGVYIPVLPQQIIDATMSPVPFVIGILKQHSKQLDENGIDEECNIVHISEKKIIKNPNVTDIPINKKYRKTFTNELKLYKKKILKQVRTTAHTIKISDMFFEVMKELIGNYQEFLIFKDGFGEIDKESFSKSREIHSDFVWQLSKTQMFASFIQGLSKESPNVFL